MNKTIILGEINKETMINYIKSLNNSTECEIRFGHFNYIEGTPPKAEFVSNVEIDFFYRLKQILNNLAGLEQHKVYTKEISYKNANDKKGKLREIIYTNENFVPVGKTEYMLKNTHRQHNIFDYNCRISLSSEKILNKVDGVSLNEPMFFRFKNRMSFLFNCGQLDMTIVYQGKTEKEALLKSNVQYEVEFEIKKPDYEAIVQIMSFIMSVRQDNLYVMNTREKRNIINQYRSLVMPQKKGHPYFIGAQPETLQKDQLSLLFKELYSVTDKADGDRFFLFIDMKGYVSFIDNNINNILKTDVKSDTHTNCLIDGELIRTTEKGQTSKIDFYAFDIVFYNGQDLRGDENYLLKERLDLLNKAILSLPANNYYSIHMKKFIYRNVFMGSDIIMKNIHNKPYKNDGLIFTPMNEPYPKSKKWIKLLKWKPAELNTIDFFSIKENNKWKLYVQNSISEQQIISDKSFKRKTNLVLFDVNKLCDIPETTQITFETSFDNSLQDPTTNEPFQTNTVIEYQWINNKFVPLRTRWDKTANPHKHGNFSTVACSIWNNINNPITELQLFQMTNTTTETIDKNFFFERMINFHTKITQYLANKYSSNNLTTSKCDKDYKEIINLELNTFNMIKSDNTFTFCNSIKKTNIAYKNFKLDLSSDNSCNIVKNSLKQFTHQESDVNSIFCLKFSPFFKSSETLNKFIELIDYTINKNGKLVLSFIDFNQTNKLKNDMYLNNNEIMYYINTSTNSNGPFNNSIKYFVNGISNESEAIEYLVNYEFLLKYMEEKGYKCIETELYQNLYKMFQDTNINYSLNEYELHISNLYRYAVFEKTESTVLSVINNKTELISISKNLIEHKNLEFYKINSSYDIYNLLNCINFTVFKKMHKNIDISSFNDISHSLNLLQINDKIVPYFTGEQTSTKSMIYFYNHYHEEQQPEENEEPIIINNFYIILYKNIIIQNTQTIDEINTLLNTPQEIPQEIPQETPQEIAQEIVQEIVQETPQETPQEIAQEIVQEIVQETPQEIPQEIVQETPQEIPQEIVQEIAQEIAQETVQEIAQEIAQETVNIKLKIKNEFNTIRDKITVIALKEYLRTLGLKTSGKKAELLDRLENTLDK
jgi:hypothetical protein